MQIEGLRKYQRRHPKGWYFQDLPAPERERARGWLKRFVTRCRARGRPLRPWLFALYVGQAKRLALHPPTSQWGRSMLAKRGGYGAQRRFLCEERNPTARATKVRLARARRFSGDRGPEAENLNTGTAYFSGVSTGYTSRDHAEAILKDIGRRLALDANFSFAIVPKTGWRWELALTRVPWPTYEP